MPRPTRKRMAVATDENSFVSHKLADTPAVQNTEIRTPLSTITNVENTTNTGRRSSSRQRKMVVYTEVAEDYVSDGLSDDKSNTSTSSSTHQIENDLMLLPEVRKRTREDGEDEDSGEEEEEESSEEESEHVSRRSRESDKERAEKLKMFEKEQSAKFAAIDDFELNFEEVAEDSFDKSMSEQSEASRDSQDSEVELADVLRGHEED